MPLERLQAPLPELVSQRTSEAVLSLPPEVFLGLVREAGCPAPIKVGRLRLVDRAAFVAWLKSRKPANQGQPEGVNEGVDDNAIAASWGLTERG